MNNQFIRIQTWISYVFLITRSLISDSWKIIYCDPVFPSDVKRSSRYPKIVPHRYLQNYDLSLYIDNSVRLIESPEIILTDLFQNNYDIALFSHSYRETVLDEFTEVARLGYDKQEIIAEQLHHMKLVVHIYSNKGLTMEHLSFVNITNLQLKIQWRIG